MGIDRIRQCEYCDSDDIKLRRKIAANGVNMFFWQCQGCSRNASKKNGWVPHFTITQWVEAGKIPSIEAIKVVADYTTDCICAVCGQPGAEFHHYAPQALADLFGADWSSWPGGYLCQLHHRLWHSIVTWYMPGPAVGNEEMIERYGNGQLRSRSNL